MTKGEAVEDFKKLRQRLGLSAREVAEAFGLHPNYISRIERGDRPYKPLYYLALQGLSGALQGLSGQPKFHGRERDAA